MGKYHQFARAKKWRTLRKTGCYWTEEYTTTTSAFTCAS